MLQRITASCQEASEQIDVFCREQGEQLVLLAKQISHLFTEGGQLLVAGSGSLLPVAQLTVAQFVYRLGFDRPGLPAICLGSDSVLNARMSGRGQPEQHLVRQYRALNNAQHLLLVFSDADDTLALDPLCEEALENDQPVALLSFDCRKDPLQSPEIDICLSLTAKVFPRQIELAQFAGHLLCELVEMELFGR